MASLKAKTVIKHLLKKGFKRDDSHHKYFEYWYDGKVIAKTYTSHNSEDIDDFLIKAMSKQCLMDKQFFIDFAKCAKSEEEYIKLLIGKGEIKITETLSTKKG